jgi:hypothetical protein
MGCRHSSSPPSSPKLLIKNSKTFALKNKIFLQHAQKSNGIKSSKTSSLCNLEQLLDGHGTNLIKRLEFNSPCLLFDLSLTHILLLDYRQLCLININTMNMNTLNLSYDNFDIQEIVWSTQLNQFLILTTDRLYQTGNDQLELQPIHRIEV